MKFWPFLGTITYPKDNFCFHESIFQCKLSLFLTEVSFEASEENQLSYFQKGYFFKILWWFHQPHNQVKCRQKNKMFSEVFTKWTIVLKIVTFLTGQSLHMMQNDRIYFCMISLKLNLAHKMHYKILSIPDI